MEDKAKQLKEIEDHFLHAATELSRASKKMGDEKFSTEDVKVTIGDIFCAAIFLRDKRHELELEVAKGFSAERE